ncbi:MAG: hypothetical protein KIH69_003205 [Anaerolineae bacterium]|nr:hypothetical protein [Anaerolineae bacterium]
MISSDLFSDFSISELDTQHFPLLNDHDALLDAVQNGAVDLAHLSPDQLDQLQHLDALHNLHMSGADHTSLFSSHALGAASMVQFAGAGSCSACGGTGVTHWPSIGVAEVCYSCGGSGVG